MIESIQLLRPNENYEALYINGQKVREAHRLDVAEVVGALMSALDLPEHRFDVVDVEDYDDDEAEIVDDEDGNTFFDGAQIWINGEGCPEEWPFEIELEPAEDDE